MSEQTLIESRRADLNRLRDNVHQTQEEGDEAPKGTKDPKKEFYADNEGRIVEGLNLTPEEMKVYTKIQKKIFLGLFSSRLSRDRKAVKKKLPANTKEVKPSDGMTGWIYRFQCELGKDFTMMVFFDGAFYQVQVLEPKLERKWHNPHTGHIFSSGLICLGADYDSGMPTLESAYAKSTLWATGISIALKTGKFPFNYNQ